MKRGDRPFMPPVVRRGACARAAIDTHHRDGKQLFRFGSINQPDMAIKILVVLLALLSPALRAQTKELDQALRQMETAGKNFRTFTANFSQKKYTAVLQLFDAPESGEFYYARGKDGSALVRQEVARPAPRILTIKGGSATIFQPKINQAQIASLGKHKDKAEYLALGLGQSPAKLKGAYDIRYAGDESVGARACWKLELKPKSAAAAAYFPLITLWLDKTKGIPIQQKLQEPNGDYLLVTFSNEKLNQKIPDSKFEQKLPAGVEIQRLQ
jgi:outer membrane lipoprotein-sorting protein